MNETMAREQFHTAAAAADDGIRGALGALLNQGVSEAAREVAEAARRTERTVAASSSTLSAPAAAAFRRAAATEASMGGVVVAVTADGSTTWTQRGTDEVGDGRLCRWTSVRGRSEDGTREWEERWWETSDRFGYRELGAAKEGRETSGAVWSETWTEALDEGQGGLTAVQRSADKRGRDAEGSEWHERWNEYYEDGGLVDKSADKWARLPPGHHPAPGHGSYWHERWGERYEADGGEITKWTDRWAEREAEGTAWGDKWEERHNANSAGGGRKVGETWKHYPGGQWQQWWGEESVEGGVRKHGHNADGHSWDSTEHGSMWVSGPHFNFDMALAHSKKLLDVKLRHKLDN